MRKRIFQSFLVLMFCVFLIPFFTAASCGKGENYMGGNINKLEKQLVNDETFVFYYGTDRCQSCQNAKKVLKTNGKIKNAIKDYKNKTKAKFAIYGYSSIHDAQKSARKEFDQQLKQLFKKMNVTDGDKLVDTAVPLILFFKKGENITNKNVGLQPNFVEEFVKNLNKLI